MSPESHPALPVVRPGNAPIHLVPVQAEAGGQTAQPENGENNIDFAQPVEKANQEPISKTELKNFERGFVHVKGFVDYYKRFPSIDENCQLYQ